MKKIKISVAMATYNGSKYIKEQLESILNQTLPVDEIIISDDGSTDETIKNIKSLGSNIIHIIDGPKLGVKKNFENAIKKTTGDLIFLSDQDDVWEKNKVEKIVEAFKNNECTLIIHNADIVNEKLNKIGEDIFTWRNSGRGILKNIIKNSYIGCCMSFKKELISHVIPIPNDIEMHDQWIGIVNEKKCGKSLFIEEKLILYRRHTENTSGMTHHPLKKMILNRLIFLKNYRRM